MPNPTLYIHSYQYEYSVDTTELYYSYDIVFPDDVTIPANTAVDVDVKIRVAMYCPVTGNHLFGLAIIPKQELLNTPLIQALGCLSATNETGAADLSIAVRNVSDSNYFISANTCLFSLVFKQYTPMNVRLVDLDHPMMT